MWQPGWEGSLGENRMYIYDWVVCWAPETITTSLINYFSFSTVQSLSLVWLFVIPWTAACQASLSITNSRSLPNSCPLSRWCHPTISSSVIPFSFCPQSLPASGSFQMSQLFTSCVQSIGASASTSVLPMNTQDWYPLGWTGWMSLQSKGLSRVFSNTTVQKHQFFSVTYLLFPLHPRLELQATTDIFNVSVIFPLPYFHKVGITYHLFSLFKLVSFTCVCVLSCSVVTNSSPPHT